jgi:hypothetical protein
MKRMRSPLGALALAGASYAVAQNVEGLDIQAVLARGKAGRAMPRLLPTKSCAAARPCARRRRPPPRPASAT